jgi:O-antigen/teichoic acid export membrane protein
MMPENSSSKALSVEREDSPLEPQSLWAQLRFFAKRWAGSSFFLNLFSVSGGAVLQRLMGLVAFSYTARVLGPEKYGLLGFGISVAAYAAIFLSPGLLIWGTREIARQRSTAGKILVIVNAAQLLLASVAYGALVIFARFFFSQPSERLIVILCGLALFNTALSVDWVVNGLELMRIPAILGTCGAGLNLIALFLLVHSPRDVYIYALIPAVNGLLLTAVLYFIIIQRLKVHLPWPSWQESRQALLSSLPLGGMVALTVVLHYANNLIVQAYLGLTALGVFWSAFRLLELASQVPTLLSTVFLPRLARVATSAPDLGRREALLFARVHMVSGFFLAAFFLGESPAIIRLIFGAKYLGAVPLLRIMSIGVIFNYAICGYTNCLISFGKDWVMLRVVGVALIVSVGGGLLVVPRAGIMGAALVVSAIDLAGWLVSLPYYRQVVGSFQFAAWWRPALGAGCVVASCFLLQALGLAVWVRIPLSALAYFPFVYGEMRRFMA